MENENAGKRVDTQIKTNFKYSTTYSFVNEKKRDNSHISWYYQPIKLSRRRENMILIGCNRSARCKLNQM